MKHSSIYALFLDSLRQSPAGSLADLLHLASEAETSFLMEICPLQDPIRFRMRHIGLQAANLLIDEKGDLDESQLYQLIHALEKPYCLGPGRENDAQFYLQLRSALRFLDQNLEIRKWLKKFSPPICHKKAEEIIRDTLWPEEVKKIEASHIRKAVLASWFTGLRQTVGSCFATAPAILIQQNDPLSLFEDLYDLLTTGRLKRIIGGQQYTVPLCPSFESSDLRKAPPLESLPFSPGLRAACASVGLVHSPQQIAEFLRDLDQPIHTDQILRRLLLKHLDLTEQDIEEEAYLKKMQMSPLLARQGGVYFQRTSHRSQKVADWKKRLAQATRVFSAFTECALLRAWEYTIASFCDVKLDFTRWNLYVGLGLHPDQKGGIGAFLYERIDFRLQECNREIQRATEDYEKAASAIRTLEGMVNRSLGDSHRHQLQAELGTYVHAANMALEIRNRMVQKADLLSQIFSQLIGQYDLKLQDYFQEIYDPSLFISEEAIFDDSPAGFRLVYKHGRLDPSLWTLIQSGEQYVDSLRDFFILTEPDLSSMVNSRLFPTLISDLTTELVQFIQEPRFLQAAIARSNQNPLHQSAYKTPWDYASGGTMQTLLQGYYQRARPFTEIGAVAKTEEELIHLLTNIHSSKPLLMNSPTHAFILQNPLPARWREEIEKGRKFWASQIITEEIQERAAHLLSERIPPVEQNLFLHQWRNSPSAHSFISFRANLIQALLAIKGSKIKEPQSLVDSFLYEAFPLLPVNQAKQMAKNSSFEGSYVSSYEFFESLKEETMKKGIFYPEDIETKLLQTVRELGCAYPSPLLFADTNWAGWYFGWIFAPSGSLELWRLNRTGSRGFPMTSWKHWFTPEQAAPWIILTQPDEYTVYRKN